LAGWLCRLEASVDADRAGQVRAGSRELADRSPAEAVVHGRDVPVKPWMSDEHLNASVPSPSNVAAVGHELLDARQHALTVAGHGPAVHVAGEHEESEFGEVPRAAVGVILQLGAAVNDEDSRMGEYIAVRDEEAGQLGVSVAVVDDFFFSSMCIDLLGWAQRAGRRRMSPRSVFGFSPRSPASVIKMSL
jgi:hypothetical protein